jgi:hypothetical protein
MYDKDTQRVVGFFQEISHASYVERDQVKYVKRYADSIETTGQLFEYLSLAELDEKSPMGWRPTPVLLYLMDEQAARKSKPNRRSISLQGGLLMNFLRDAVFGAERDELGGCGCALGFIALRELGLLREDWDGYCAPTQRLLWLFDDAYGVHQARSQ